MPVRTGSKGVAVEPSFLVTHASFARSENIVLSLLETRGMLLVTRHERGRLCNRFARHTSDVDRLARGIPMQLRPAIAVSLALLTVPLTSIVASPGTSVGTARPSVAILELFTAEGCSSCPPADALLRQINLKQTNGGPLIIGISEHVTYWNHLGWKDPYSSSVFTDRQRSTFEAFTRGSLHATDGPERSRPICGK
jgi:hypothetical protein